MRDGGRVFLITFMEYYFWDGEDHYFVDVINNLSFCHIELIHANPVKDQIYHDLVLGINSDAQKEPLYSWLQYQNLPPIAVLTTFQSLEMNYRIQALTGYGSPYQSIMVHRPMLP